MTNAFEGEQFRAKVNAAREAFLSHPGYVVFVHCEGLGATLKNVVQRNFEELVMLLDAPNNDVTLAIELISNVMNTDRRNQYLAELDQRLHNYLASAFSLVEHVRRILPEERDDDIARKHEERKKVFLSHPETRFVQDLRNFTMHRKLPVVTSNLSMSDMNTPQASMSFRILLSVPQLLEGDMWSASSKKYMSQQGDSVDVRPLVAKHVELVYQLNMQLINEMVKANSADLTETNKLVAVHNLLLTGGMSYEHLQGWEFLQKSPLNIDDIPTVESFDDRNPVGSQ